VERLPDAAAAIGRVMALADAGAAVVWVRNSVDDAIEAVSALRLRGAQPILFHARFTMADRLTIERDVLRRFARDSRGTERHCILVATQVVEQSLDLDFDAMVTDLAPADLLIQRAGRLWRHRREARPLAEPVLHIVSPDPVDEPPADWGRSVIPRTLSVYRDPALLWRSARAVFSRGGIATPDDMRSLIEAAGDVTNTPAALQPAANKAGGKISADAAVGLMNALVFEDGYTRDSGAWDPDTAISTRLEDDPTVTLRLAVETDGILVPKASDGDLARGWALSEVRVAKRRIAGCMVPEHLARAAKASWTRREREAEDIVLGMLRPAGDGYVISVLDRDGKAFEASYDDTMGLSLPERG
jgi:CRISPR-associated endonuclease/helicase Cas3